MFALLGGLREAYWAISPYLAQADEALLDWIEAELAEQLWGIFAVSNLPLHPVFEHLRDQLTVTLADGQRWHYRFYDPRVLQRHLERGQTGTLFGTFAAMSFPPLHCLRVRRLCTKVRDVENGGRRRLMPPAARVTDMHTRPAFNGPVPHVGGPILPLESSPDVFINSLPAAMVGTMATCVGPPDSIAKG